MSRHSGEMARQVRRALVWYRTTDLRLLDHEPLHRAHAQHTHVSHVFCFDPRLWSGAATVDYSRSMAPTGLLRLGRARRRFLIESVADLRAQLRAKSQSDLILCVGRPEDVLPRVAAECAASTLLFTCAEADEEERVEAAVGAALAESGVAVDSIWGNTLIHIDDLPASVDPRKTMRGAVRTFSQFRTAVEKGRKSGVSLAVRPPLPIPTPFRPECARTEAQGGSVAFDATTSVAGVAQRAWSCAAADALLVGSKVDADGAAAPGLPRPPLPPLSVAAGEWSALAAATFVGGESAALAHVERWMFGKDLLKTYKKTRNGLLGVDYSSKVR